MKLGRRALRAEVPAAPMVGIAFLLILFFLVTGVFSATRGLELTLPKDPQPDGGGKEATFIRVHADSSILVDCKPMTPSEMLDYLEPRLRQDPERQVVLYTDAEAPYQAMIRVYDALAGAPAERGFKVQNVSVPTLSEVQEYVALFGVNPFERPCEAEPLIDQ